MPAPLPDLTRDQQCHFYMAPTGQRCGSPAIKGDYYCYHHHLTNAKRNQRRVLIDPEVTRMELPPIEDRASIFVALAAVVHRLAENTIDTRRAGQMIYGLQVALQTLEPAPAAKTAPAAGIQPAPERAGAPHLDSEMWDGATIEPSRSGHSPRSDPRPAGRASQPTAETQPASGPADVPSAEKTFAIRKQDLLYFLRSRHCARCNFELFPASELTERRHPGAPPEIIEESRPALTAPNRPPDPTPAEFSTGASDTDVSNLDESGSEACEIVLNMQAAAEPSNPMGMLGASPLGTRDHTTNRPTPQKQDRVPHPYAAHSAEPRPPHLFSETPGARPWSKATWAGTE